MHGSLSSVFLSLSFALTVSHSVSPVELGSAKATLLVGPTRVGSNDPPSLSLAPPRLGANNMNEASCCQLTTPLERRTSRPWLIALLIQLLHFNK